MFYENLYHILSFGILLFLNFMISLGLYGHCAQVPVCNDPNYKFHTCGIYCCNTTYHTCEIDNCDPTYQACEIIFDQCDYIRYEYECTYETIYFFVSLGVFALFVFICLLMAYIDDRKLRNEKRQLVLKMTAEMMEESKA